MGYIFLIPRRIVRTIRRLMQSSTNDGINDYLPHLISHFSFSPLSKSFNDVNNDVNKVSPVK